MIGDRLDADILFGKQGGLATLLVLTGTDVERVTIDFALNLMINT